MNTQRLALAVAAIVTLTLSAPVNALTFDANVTPDVIFGDGNDNGSFTVHQANDAEVGLRAKLRHNGAGDPENTFNSNGDGTYTFLKGVAPTQSFPTAVWSVEWSINSNYTGTGSNDLNDLTYSLQFDSDPGPGVDYSSATFDPINGTNPGNGMVFWDHSIGNNSSDEDSDSIATDATDYGNLIASNNVAQNSWKAHWVFPGFDPNVIGVYSVALSTSNGASTTIDIHVVPEPTTFAMAGLGIAMVGCGLRRRRR